MKTITAMASPASVDISSFAVGAYWVVIDRNGAILHTQKVVKQ